MDKVVDHLLVFKGNAQLKDFPGNYSDYRVWKEETEKSERAEQQAEQAKKIVKDNTSTEKTAQPRKNKLSFKEKRELEELDVLIPQLEAEKAELENAMSSGTLSNDELMVKSTRIGEVMKLIDEKSMRWLELSEIEG